MSKKDITPEQLKEISDIDTILKRLVDVKEDLKHYKIGDVFILEFWDKHDPEHIQVDRTSVGLPAKWQVVFISPHGIPYLRRLSSTNKPTGDMRLPHEAEFISTIRRSARLQDLFENEERFVPDPEQLDAILLQEEYDPTAQQAEKSKLFNEINKHNKQAQVSTGFNCYRDIANFFKTRKPGDKFWTSPDKQFVIQSVVKHGKEYRITAIGANGALLEFNFSYFSGKRLYKEQPRSFTKESK